MLGHSPITITADTYTTLLPEADLAIAEAAARPYRARPRHLRERPSHGGARARRCGEARHGIRAERP